MQNKEHAWRTAQAATGQRFFLGAIVAASFTLVAFEWHTPELVVERLPDLSHEEDWPEPVFVIRSEKPNTEKRAAKKSTAAIDPIAAVEPGTEPPTDPTTDPGPGTPDPGPTPDPAPTNGSGTTTTVTPFVPNAGVKPYFERCFREDPEHVDPCTEERIQAHLQREFRMPRSVRGHVRTTVTFRVEVDGRVGRIVCAPKVDPEVVQEVERVLRSMPRFVPGSQGGVPVPVHYQIPLSLRMG